MNLSTVYKPDLKYRMRTIAKRPILFGNGNCYELNEVAQEIWANIDGLTEVSEIVGQLAEEYDCKPETVQNDVVEFIQFLLDIKAISED